VINDLLLRWVATGLFVLSAAVWGFAVVTQHRAWTSAISNGLHFVMAIAMAVMVWPWGAHVPTTGPALFFLVATAWFVTMIVVSARTMAQRAVCGYHALMMLAMVWMYADTKHHHFPNHSGSHHPTSPDTPMPGMDVAATGTPTSESHEWVSAFNWFWFVGFAVATIFWAYRFTRERRYGAADDWHGRMGSGAQAMTAAGMAIAFGAILFQS
jgi:hypothetical protein